MNKPLAWRCIGLAVITQLLLLLHCCSVPLHAQTPVSGIPSEIVDVVGGPNGMITATTSAFRQYLSRDSGATFVAIDTADLYTEPTVPFPKGTKYMVVAAEYISVFSGDGKYLWSKTRKGGTLARYDLQTGIWESNFAYNTTCGGLGPFWIRDSASITSVATGKEADVAVVINYGEEARGCNRVLYTRDGGDTWINLPPLDYSKPLEPTRYSHVGIAPDGTVLVTVHDRVFWHRLGDPDWTRSSTEDARGDRFTVTDSVVYLYGSRTLWRSRDNGVTFIEIAKPVGNIENCTPWSNDTVMLTINDYPQPNKYLWLLADTTIAERSFQKVEPAPYTPFVASIGNLSEPVIVKSGNNLNQLLFAHSGQSKPPRFEPETYSIRNMKRVGRGFVAHISTHGVFLIDSIGNASIDTAVSDHRTGSIRLWGSEYDHYIIEINNRGAHLVNTLSGALQRVPSSVQWDVLLGAEVAYSRVTNDGIRVTSLLDTSDTQIINLDLPLANDIEPNEYLTGSPLGEWDEGVVCIADAVNSTSARSISDSGGLFFVTDRWKRLNDSALGNYRQLLPWGDSRAGLTSFAATNVLGSISSIPKKFFVYDHRADSLLTITPGVEPHEYFSSTVVDSAKILLVGYGEYLLARNVIDGSIDEIHIGLMRDAVASGNQIAISTLHRGILMFPAKQIMTGIKEQDVSDQPKLDIYPNPAADYFSFRWPGNSDAVVDVHIIDSSGELVMHQPRVHMGLDGTRRIDTRNLPAGMYTVVVNADAIHYVGKLVVMGG